MSIIKRRVSFYLLVLKNDKNSKDNKEVKNEIFRIINGLKNIDKNRNAVLFDFDNRDFIFETITGNKGLVFIKIGRKTPSDTVALRNMNTLTSNDVKMKKNESLEVFTYCMLDLKTGVISYIGNNIAPRISILNSFLNNFKTIDDYQFEIVPILDNDIISDVLKKDIIGSIELCVAMPSDDILCNIIDDKNYFYKIDKNSIKTQSITIKISASRNKNLFKDNSFINELLDKFTNSIKSFQIKAKDSDEKMQVYDLLKYHITQTVDLHDNNKGKLAEGDYLTALKKTYDFNLNKISKFIRKNND